MRNKKEPYAVLALAMGLSLSTTPVLASSYLTKSDASSIQQQKSSQTRQLTGTVTDASSGEPLIGVTIQIKNGKTGVVTDLDGHFTIDVTNKTELVVSYLSYKTMTVMVGDLGVINIKMKPDDQQLDEVVVVGAGTSKKVSITGSISTVKGTLLKTPSSSLTNGLAGKLAGVMSSATSGEPGSTSSFYIRGINTFGGVATPLILLDGVEISSSDLNRIPSESIESFSVLKDASATAIYGNRGANGVMLITTKSGEENSRARINVTLEASYNRPMKKVDFVDGVTYMKLYNEAQDARANGNVTHRYSDEKIQNTANNVDPYAYPNVNWYDMLFKSGNFNERANVNIQGGGSRVTYYMSLQANHDTGLINAPKNYYYDSNFNHWEYNFQNNISYKITNTTTAELRMMAQIGNEKGPNYSVSDLYKQVMRANPVDFPAYFPSEEGDGKTLRFGNQEISTGTYGVNPYAYMLSSYKETNYNTLNTSLNIHQDLGFISKGLKAHVLVNFKNWSSASYNRYLDKQYLYRVKEGSYNKETGTYETELLQKGSDYITQSGNSKSSDQTFYFDARLDWKRSFSQHNLSAMLMYMMREYRSDVLPNRNQGISGRLTYDFANKYLFEFNFGYNGSERLAKGDRFEFFPAASIGWVVSSEKFWKPIEKYVNFFKLRASYGLVGSDQFNGSAPHFLYQNSIGIGSGHSFWTGLPTSETSRKGPAFWTLAISNAGWEHVKKFDFGIDMKLFDQVNITFDYFHDVRDRILMSRSSWSTMLGYWGSTPWSNIGKVTNQGIELSANWNKRINKDLNFDVRANFTYNQNRYDYVDEPNYPYVWQTKTGKPLNTLTGYVAEGLFESQEEIDNWADQSQLGSNIRPGDIKYRDINGDGKITTEDQVLLSPYNGTPRIQYGFGFNMQYKKWDFGVFFNGSAKRKIMINSGYAPFLSQGGDGITNGTLPRNMMQWIADEHWSEDNPNPDAKYPRLGVTEADISNNVQPSSYWVRNGNFLRFKTLELGYTFKYCRVYFSGDNIAVFSPFKLWDPELSWNAYPLQRTFNLGVQVRL
ncbi:MAG TPA: SusC/RagA family protein [Prevotella sp.]|nr:SusC/RagA family protein [Candidatus Segatella violae]